MTIALSFADLPSLVQEAMSRKPRRVEAERYPGPDEKNTQNNYRAEDSPNWGRNRKGAGAPPGNRNAFLGGLSRAESRLQRRLKIQAARIAAALACIEQLENRLPVTRA